jgi:hypothetical protein
MPGIRRKSQDTAELALVDTESRSEDYVSATQYTNHGITDYTSREAQEEFRPLI